MKINEMCLYESLSHLLALLSLLPFSHRRQSSSPPRASVSFVQAAARLANLTDDPFFLLCKLSTIPCQRER